MYGALMGAITKAWCRMIAHKVKDHRQGSIGVNSHMF